MVRLKALLAYPAFTKDVETLVDSLEVYQPGMESGKEFDLVIFSGGADVNPELYNPGMEKKYKALCSVDLKRDEREWEVFHKIMSGEIKTKRVLGICRGLQIINVFLGGDLYPDLHSYGRAHEYFHGIDYQVSASQRIIRNVTSVNSLHHQAVATVGTYYQKRDIPFSRKVIAVDSTYGIPEIVWWGTSEVQILGVQYHPEFFRDGLPEKDSFISDLRKWVEG